MDFLIVHGLVKTFLIVLLLQVVLIVDFAEFIHCSFDLFSSFSVFVVCIFYSLFYSSFWNFKYFFLQTLNMGSEVQFEKSHQMTALSSKLSFELSNSEWLDVYRLLGLTSVGQKTFVQLPGDFPNYFIHLLMNRDNKQPDIYSCNKITTTQIQISRQN